MQKGTEARPWPFLARLTAGAAVRIAQIAPLIESVPPRRYGGTERVVSYLTEELVRQGHDVTLFASGDSETSARLVPCCERALRLDPRVGSPLPYHVTMLDNVRREAHRFDVLHFHTDLLHFQVFSATRHATLTTLHGRQDLFDLRGFYAAFPSMPLVSISQAQRRPIAGANFAGTVHHGLPEGLLQPTYRPNGDYLAFLGRISPEKRVDRAIEIARAFGMPLKIAAKVDRVDEDYFRHTIAPLLNGPGVQFIGEITERQKAGFIGNARALLFPIDWPEPFGLVMIEAMACGTPVLAFEGGSVREVVDQGVTGIIVRSVEEAIGALRTVIALDRRAVRRRFEQRFAAGRMAADYVRLYERVVAPARSSALVPLRVVAGSAVRSHQEPMTLSDA
jgi:glycosyltransferase involved in cell wall biosynthesis